MTMLMLPENRYPLIESLLQELPINTLFARSVVARHVRGRAYVDDLDSPRAAYIAHPYGMSLLFGSPVHEGFLGALSRYLTGNEPHRSTDEWLQVYPDEWNEVLCDLLGKRLVSLDSTVADAARGPVVQHTRVNFHFDIARYAQATSDATLPADCTIVDDVEWIHAHMRGSVVPSEFWDDAKSLTERGAAFAVLERGELASAAFASFVMDEKLELGVETVQRFRGKGLAYHACRGLIDYCLRRNLEPVWACRQGNIGSYRLAIKLGFDHVRSLPYYRLPKSTSPD